MTDRKCFNGSRLRKTARPRTHDPLIGRRMMGLITGKPWAGGPARGKACLPRRWLVLVPRTALPAEMCPVRVSKLGPKADHHAPATARGRRGPWIG